MEDINNVINGLECCTNLGCHHGCAYKKNDKCRQSLEKDALELLKKQQELESCITKYADKTVVFPRLSGRTASQLERMMELVKSGEPIVYISPDCTTEFKPVIYCKDCKHYDSGLCWNVPKNEPPRPKEETFFCADGKRKEGEQE